MVVTANGRNVEKMINEPIAFALHHLIEKGIISNGKAAELLGVNKLDLIDFYGQHGFPYIDMTEEEFLQEIEPIPQKVERKKIVLLTCETCGREYLIEPCPYCSIKKCLEGFDEAEEILKRV